MPPPRSWWGRFCWSWSAPPWATAAILGRTTAGPAYDSLAIALAFGLLLVALVGARGHNSGCHVNPAVSLGLASIGEIPWRYVPAYIGAQLLGAVLAAFTLLGSYGSRARTEANLGATALAPDSTNLQTFLMEIQSGSCWSSSSSRSPPTPGPSRCRPRCALASPLPRACWSPGR